MSRRRVTCVNVVSLWLQVGDLGLGRLLSEQTLEAHSKVGTPLYMSPEVLKGTGQARSLLLSRYA
jgi:serine/threonine protein kinase